MTTSAEQISQMVRLLQTWTTSNLKLDNDGQLLSSAVTVEAAPPIEFQSGDMKGPFRVRERRENQPSEGEAQITLFDQFGTPHHFEVVGNDPIVHRIRACPDGRQANAVAYQIADQMIQMAITKDIRQSEDIMTAYLCNMQPTTSQTAFAESRLASAISTIQEKSLEGEKRFTCTNCGVAKFSNYDNLTVHQKTYCRKAEVNTTLPAPVTNPITTIPTTLLPSLPLATPAPTASYLYPANLATQWSIGNVVLLPVAQHNQPQQDAVQILGPPQMIVPVAVGKQNHTTGAIFLGKTLCSSLNTPASLNYCQDGVTVTVPILQMDTPSTSTATTLPTNCSISNNSGISLKRVGGEQRCSTSSPLEVPKRPRTEERSSSNSPNKTSNKSGIIINSTPTGNSTTGNNSSSDVEKPFQCTCGVTFSALSSLNAHRQFYCKDVERAEDHREPVRKLPSRCTQCNYEPQSISQLSSHVRNVHNDIRAYLCNECGYRGYSIRGIRSHLKTHPNLEFLKFDALLNSHVTEIKGSDPTVSTESEDGDVIVT